MLCWGARSMSLSNARIATPQFWHCDRPMVNCSSFRHHLGRSKTLRFADSRRSSSERMRQDEAGAACPLLVTSSKADIRLSIAMSACRPKETRHWLGADKVAAATDARSIHRYRPRSVPARRASIVPLARRGRLREERRDGRLVDGKIRRRQRRQARQTPRHSRPSRRPRHRPPVRSAGSVRDRAAA